MKAIAKDFENYEKCGESPITLINTPFKKVGWTQKKRARKEFFLVYKREESIFMKSISKES